MQYNMARYEKAKKEADAEASRARQLNSQVQTFTKTETELRNQLNVYVDKFKQVFIGFSLLGMVLFPSKSRTTNIPCGSNR